MINEIEVQRLSKKFNLKIRIHQDTILVENGLEEWIITVYDNYIDLKHLNTASNKTGKLHFHEQRKFKNLYQAFDSIKKHKPYYKNVKRIEYMQKLFSMI